MASIIVSNFGAGEAELNERYEAGKKDGQNAILSNIALQAFLRHFSFSDKTNSDDQAHFATSSNTYLTVNSVDKYGQYLNATIRRAGRYLVKTVDTYKNYTAPVADGVHTFAANKALKWEKTVNAGGECSILIIYLGD